MSMSSTSGGGSACREILQACNTLHNRDPHCLNIRNACSTFFISILTIAIGIFVLLPLRFFIGFKYLSLWQTIGWLLYLFVGVFACATVSICAQCCADESAYKESTTTGEKTLVSWSALRFFDLAMVVSICVHVLLLWYMSCYLWSEPEPNSVSDIATDAYLHIANDPPTGVAEIDQRVEALLQEALALRAIKDQLVTTGPGSEAATSATKAIGGTGGTGILALISSVIYRLLSLIIAVLVGGTVFLFCTTQTQTREPRQHTD
jgi:hypothetical protein